VNDPHERFITILAAVCFVVILAADCCFLFACLHAR
jgi:hypothetical protein